MSSARAHHPASARQNLWNAFQGGGQRAARQEPDVDGAFWTLGTAGAPRCSAVRRRCWRAFARIGPTEFSGMPSCLRDLAVVQILAGDKAGPPRPRASGRFSSIRSTSSAVAIASASPRAVVSRPPRWARAWPSSASRWRLDHLLDADPPRHHRQVRRQRAGPLEPAEHGVIVVDDLQEDLGGDVLDVGGMTGRCCGHATRGGSHGR